MSNNEWHRAGSVVTAEQARDTEAKLLLALKALHPNAHQVSAAWSPKDETRFIIGVTYAAEVSLPDDLVPLDAEGTVALIEKLIPIKPTGCKEVAPA